jgi:hypothetical protein
MSLSTAEILVDGKGNVTVNGATLCLKGIAIKEEIDRGANGVVFRGVDTLLNRAVAVKFWLKLREKDSRNKFCQGVAEAQKAASVETDHIVNIYGAGDIEGIFYVTMEYFKSHPLKKWLGPEEHRPCSEPKEKKDDVILYTRWVFARLVVSALRDAHAANIFHGDLHTNNILIGEPFRHTDYFPAFYDRDFRIVDFGTSIMSKGISSKRHWDILEKTVDKLVQPLKMGPIWGELKPRDPEAGTAWHNWFVSYLAYLPRMILSVWDSYYAREPFPILLNVDRAPTHEEPQVVMMPQGGCSFIGQLFKSRRLGYEDIKWFLRSQDSHPVLLRDEPSWILPFKNPKE